MQESFLTNGEAARLSGPTETCSTLMIGLMLSSLAHHLLHEVCDIQTLDMYLLLAKHFVCVRWMDKLPTAPEGDRHGTKMMQARLQKGL